MRPPSFLLPIVAWLCSCSTTPADTTLDITFDPCEAVVLVPAADATPDQLAGIEEAIAMWAGRGVTTLTRQDVPGAARLPIAFDDAATAFHGVYEDEVGVVYINRDLAGHALSVTIAHEVGHALGLRHVDPDERPSLMNPGNTTIEPTPEDHEALLALWGPCGG